MCEPVDAGAGPEPGVAGPSDLSTRRAGCISTSGSRGRDRPLPPDPPTGGHVPLEPGTRLGRYEVLSPLGAGGMGEVYRARDSRLGRDVAVKVLREGASGDPG